MLFRKHGIKIFFIAACCLLAFSLVLSAYSYARYVTSDNMEADGVDMTGIDCEFTIENGGGVVFVCKRPVHTADKRQHAPRADEYVGGNADHGPQQGGSERA